MSSETEAIVRHSSCASGHIELLTAAECPEIGRAIESAAPQAGDGTRDEIGSIDTIRRFRDVMVQAGNDCVLVEYEGAEHAFHYFPEYLDTVNNVTADFLLDRLAAD